MANTGPLSLSGKTSEVKHSFTKNDKGSDTESLRIFKRGIGRLLGPTDLLLFISEIASETSDEVIRDEKIDSR